MQKKNNAKQAEEDIRQQWWWVELSVWTVRMLTALVTGVKGGKWFSLMDKVFSLPNLFASYHAVATNQGASGADHVTVEQFERDLETNLKELHETLANGTYQPQAIRRVHIPKPGSHETRPLGIPSVRDRVVQGALVHVLEPIFEHTFAEHSYGFRPGLSCHDALRRVEGLIENGYVYVVDADLKSYFGTIPHDRLLKRIEERVTDGRVLRLIESFLKAAIHDGDERWIPERGAPQGAVLSPLLSNVYLNPLDHLMASKGFAMTRYADDLVVQCQSLAEAEAALALLHQWCVEEGLTLHPTKTRIVNVCEKGFDFLGYHFTTLSGQRHVRWPREKSLKKFKDTIRKLTRRTSGRSLYTTIDQLNTRLRGWYGYFKESFHTTFQDIDAWIRMRLRSILRRRAGRRGRGRGRDHQRYPNAYFTNKGLFSLQKAHDQGASILS